ncbi:hypothetical protein [Candidatus Soleaferrea massiliensis]|uniref:hypothetical protein n=1 Tax=Candidatus Soleaferrea massiliensis TaxID=1470354 RepID=UPI00058DAB72|nr:hypothetical protein [Candidatus Soleaferrea massiliensis]
MLQRSYTNAPFMAKPVSRSKGIVSGIFSFLAYLCLTGAILCLLGASLAANTSFHESVMDGTHYTENFKNAIISGLNEIGLGLGIDEETVKTTLRNETVSKDIDASIEATLHGEVYDADIDAFKSALTEAAKEELTAKGIPITADVQQNLEEIVEQYGRKFVDSLQPSAMLKVYRTLPKFETPLYIGGSVLLLLFILFIVLIHVVNRSAHRSIRYDLFALTAGGGSCILISAFVFANDMIYRIPIRFEPLYTYLAAVFGTIFTALLVTGIVITVLSLAILLPVYFKTDDN